MKNAADTRLIFLNFPEKNSCNRGRMVLVSKHKSLDACIQSYKMCFVACDRQLRNAMNETLVMELDRNTASPTESAVYGK